MLSVSDLLRALKALFVRIKAALRAFGAKAKGTPLFGEYERVEEAKYYPPAPPPASFLEDGELSTAYGETKLVALIVNPLLVHVYWNLDPGTLASVCTQRGIPALLRFHDTDDGSWFDLKIDVRTNNSYVDLWSPGRSYCIELGVTTPGGGFAGLARSNVVRTPRAWPAGEDDRRHSIAGEGFWSDSGSPAPPEGARAHQLPHTAQTDAAPHSERRIAGKVSTEVGALHARTAKAPVSPGAGISSPAGPADLTALAEQDFSGGISSSGRSQGPGRPANL